MPYEQKRLTKNAKTPNIEVLCYQFMKLFKHFSNGKPVPSFKGTYICLTFYSLTHVLPYSTTRKQ